MSPKRFVWISETSSVWADHSKTLPCLSFHHRPGPANHLSAAQMKPNSGPDDATSTTPLKITCHKKREHSSPLRTDLKKRVKFTNPSDWPFLGVSVCEGTVPISDNYPQISRKHCRQVKSTNTQVSRSGAQGRGLLGRGAAASASDPMLRPLTVDPPSLLSALLASSLPS